MSDAKPTVHDGSPAYRSAEQDRELPRALLGRSRAMLAARLKYNPPHPGESVIPKQERGSKIVQSPYDRRAKLAELYPFYEDAIDDAVGAVIAEQIHIGNDVPGLIARHLEDIDQRGNNLTEFARQVARDSLGDAGVSWILVDHPRLGAGVTTADLGPQDRAYWVHIAARNLLNPEDYTFVNGRFWRLTARIIETYRKADGTTPERVRILTAPPVNPDGSIPEGAYVTWGLYVADDKGNWPEIGSPPNAPGVNSGVMRPQTAIPLVPYYTGYRSERPARPDPPFGALAGLNRLHYAKRSDLDNDLAKMVPAMHRAGCSDKEAESQTLFAAGTILHSRDAGATAEPISFSRDAVDAKAADLKTLEERMEKLALEPHAGRAANASATGSWIDHVKAKTEVAAWALGLGDAIGQALRFHAVYHGIDPERAGGVTVPYQARIAPLDAQAVPVIVKAMQAVGYSDEQIADELQRRGTLSADAGKPAGRPKPAPAAMG